MYRPYHAHFSTKSNTITNLTQIHANDSLGFMLNQMSLLWSNLQLIKNIMQVRASQTWKLCLGLQVTSSIGCIVLTYLPRAWLPKTFIRFICLIMVEVVFFFTMLTSFETGNNPVVHSLFCHIHTEVRLKSLFFLYIVVSRLHCNFHSWCIHHLVSITTLA